MVKHDVAAKKVAEARRRLAQADTIFGQPGEAVPEDEAKRDLACFYLLLAIQECIDLAAHWVSDADWGPPEDVGGVFDILAKKEVIPKELAASLRGATGLRNRIAHGYSALDPQRIWSEYPAGSASLREFLGIVSLAIGL